MGHINVNRLDSFSHFASLQAKCLSTYFDVIAITETFLTKDSQDKHLALDGFKLIRLDRENKEGGGVALYVRNHYAVNILVTSEPVFNNTPEFLIAEMKNKNVKILCAVIYRRPEASSPLYFFEWLSAHLPHYNNVIITGDFNANLTIPNHTDSKILLNLIDSNALSVVSYEPTHHLIETNPPSHTTLDLFM